MTEKPQFFNSDSVTWLADNWQLASAAEMLWSFNYIGKLNNRKINASEKYKISYTYH